MTVDNAYLDSIGVIDKAAYWQDKTTQDTLDAVDASDRQAIKDAYLQAMLDLQTIIDQVNPTNAQVIWAVKKIAAIDKNILLYLKSEITGG